MEPVWILGNLQTQALIPHRVVFGHDSLLVHAQDFSEGGADPRDEGGTRLRCPHHTPSMMLRENVLGQIPVGRRPLRDPGQGQLVGQPVLQGAEGARRPARASGE